MKQVIAIGFAVIVCLAVLYAIVMSTAPKFFKQIVLEVHVMITTLKQLRDRVEIFLDKAEAFVHLAPSFVNAANDLAQLRIEVTQLRAQLAALKTVQAPPAPQPATPPAPTPSTVTSPAEGLPHA